MRAGAPRGLPPKLKKRPTSEICTCAGSRGLHVVAKWHVHHGRAVAAQVRGHRGETQTQHQHETRGARLAFERFEGGVLLQH